MRNKLLFFITIFSLLSFGLYFYLRQSIQKKSKWSFVSHKTAWVYESSHFLNHIDSIQKKVIGKPILDLLPQGHYFHLFENKATEIQLKRLLNNTSAFLCFSPISSKNLDVLFVLNTGTVQKKEKINALLDSQFSKSNLKKKRKFEGFEMTEYFNSAGYPIFAVTHSQHFLICSSSSFLVEDAIRTHNQSIESFHDKWTELTQLNTLNQDAGNLYFNHNELNKLLHIFSKDPFNILGKSSFLDFSLGRQFFKFSGFTFPKKNTVNLFQVPTKPFTIFEVLPLESAIVRHYSFEHFGQFRQNLIDSTSKNEKLRPTLLIQNVGNEIARVQLEVLDVQEESHDVVFIQIKNINLVENYLKNDNEKQGENGGGITKIENYPIYQLQNVDLTKSIAGPISQLENNCFYTFHGSYLIMSNTLKELKRVVVAIVNEETWKKSIKFNRILSFANREVSYNYFVQFSKALPYLQAQLSNEWKSWFQTHHNFLEKLDFLAIQLTKIQSKLYNNSILYFNNTEKITTSHIEKIEKEIDNPISSKPYVFKNPITQKPEVIIQDSTSRVYHFSSDFTKLWEMYLDAPIKDPILGVDFYKNGKTQYAFVAKNQLHIVDRQGQYVKGFPKKLPSDKATKFFSIVDYDGSKNYRFMFTDEENNIFLMNKEGKLLEGWNPKSKVSELIMPPQHARVSGSDIYILVADKEIDIIRRNGTSFSGFPLTFDESILPNYFIEENQNFSSSTFTFLHAEGEKITFNFSGQIVNRNQIPKEEKDTKFEFIPDILGNTFIIVRNTLNKWEILDKKGKKIFEKYFDNPEEKMVQFYHFGFQNSIYAFFQPHKQQMEVYNYKGDKMTQNALESQNILALLFSNDTQTYTLFVSNQNKVEKIILKK